MNDVAHLELSTKRRIAYHTLPAKGDCASLPGLIFLGGFKSDMTGVKATWLQARSGTQGRAFIRFDYRGHGQSSGQFEDGCIGDWADDAAEVLKRLTTGPQILIGSSMGGWIALLLARRHPARIAGLIGIAAAPDFTEDGIAATLTDDQKHRMQTEGKIAVPSQYSEQPYVLTRHLVEEGRNHLVLRSPLTLHCPVRLLHGTADPDVDHAVSLRLLEHLDGPDTRLTLVKGADHRFSDHRALDILGRTIEELTQTIAASRSEGDRRR